MQIQVNTDHNIRGSESLASHVKAVVDEALCRFAQQISRVEVHLSDENGHKTGQNDKRCMLEARIEGRQPVAVTHHGATLDLAVDGAANKLASVLESSLDRLRDKRS